MRSRYWQPGRHLMLWSKQVSKFAQLLNLDNNALTENKCGYILIFVLKWQNFSFVQLMSLTVNPVLSGWPETRIP